MPPFRKHSCRYCSARGSGRAHRKRRHTTLCHCHGGLYLCRDHGLSLLCLACLIVSCSNKLLPKVFPISPRNSPTAIVNMLGKVSAHRLMVTSSHLQSLILGLEDELAHAIDGYHLSFEELPGLPIIYPCLAHERPEDPFTPFPRPTCMISPQSAVIYLHSSGSTGFPKPVPYTQEVIASHRYARQLFSLLSCYYISQCFCA